MKKSFVLILVLALILSCAGCASTQTLTLTEANLVMEIPEDLVVFTRDMPEDDPILERYETNSKGITRGLMGRDSYAYVFDADMTFGLDLCRVFSKTQDYRSLDQAGRDALAEEYTAAFPEGSAPEIQCLTLNDEVWIYYEMATDSGYFCQWATNRNNQLFYASLTARDQAAAQAQKPWIQQALTDLSFGE